MSELPTGFVTADHALLFKDDDGLRCDVCSETLASKYGEDDAGFHVPGSGLLVWARGDERRYQEPPLCATCAAAIGLSALQRWEIEEEEG
jgi:hypothetical protein